MNKIVMMVLDGFGYREEEEGNAIKLAKMDNYEELLEEYPYSLLAANGDAIGLPDDTAADCEVGHLTIGAGKRIKQDITLCNEVLGSTLIEKNANLINFLTNLEEKDGTLHLMGMVSNGCIHSDITYMKNLITHLKNLGVKKLYFHAITDGKDVPKDSAIQYLEELEGVMKEVKLGKIASICGRSFAMDRDNKWDKVKVYTDLLFKGSGVSIKNYAAGINACYKKDVFDENIPPILLDEKGIISNNDGIIWLNYRMDRSRELLSILTDPNFNLFRTNRPNNLSVITLLPINNMEIDYLLENNEDVYSLCSYLDDLNIKQARIASSEKFPHITYFLNGEENKKLSNCDDFMIPSGGRPRYDEDPTLTIDDIIHQTIRCMEKDYDLIIVNICNPDMLGHSGNMENTITALKKIDESLEELFEAADDNFYKVIITSDHGNVDEMLDAEGNVKKAHSLNPVPFIVRDKKVSLRHKGDLTNIAPTILKYMDIAIPEEMQDTRVLLLDEE